MTSRAHVTGDSDEFHGTTVFISGAGSGIGRATSIAFAAAGASVVAADRDAVTAGQTAALIEAAGGQALPVRCDVTSASDLDAAFARVVDRFGGLDVAFNNAGVEQQQRAPLAETDPSEWDRLLDVDVRGMFLAMQREIPLILARGGGAIVNASSGAGLIGIQGQAVYTAAKHAVVGLTRAAALDYADTGLRINAVAPGMIDTPMSERVSDGTDSGYAALIAEEPAGRLGRPEEIASAVLWLCSPSNTFTIGHTLVVDGAQTIR